MFYVTIAECWSS
jgi:hypothetical protein